MKKLIFIFFILFTHYLLSSVYAATSAVRVLKSGGVKSVVTVSGNCKVITNNSGRDILIPAPSTTNAVSSGAWTAFKTKYDAGGFPAGFTISESAGSCPTWGASSWGACMGTCGTTGTKTLTYSCRDSYGNPASNCTGPQPPDEFQSCPMPLCAPIVTLTANPATVSYNGSTVLSWTVSGGPADSCTSSIGGDTTDGGWTGTRCSSQIECAAGGSMTITNITTPTSKLSEKNYYRIRCVGPEGAPPGVQREVIMNELPPSFFIASTPWVVSGESARLVYSITSPYLPADCMIYGPSDWLSGTPTGYSPRAGTSVLSGSGLYLGFNTLITEALTQGTGITLSCGYPIIKQRIVNIGINQRPVAVMDVYDVDTQMNRWVRLTGSGSSDPDGDSLFYLWTIDYNRLDSDNSVTTISTSADPGDYYYTAYAVGTYYNGCAVKYEDYARIYFSVTDSRGAASVVQTYDSMAGPWCGGAGYGEGVAFYMNTDGRCWLANTDDVDYYGTWSAYCSYFPWGNSPTP